MGKRIISLQEAQSVTNNDYLVIDNQSGGTKKVSAGFINDIVSDVEVDGTSVVNNGVAEIDLSGKQDAIVAGSNITIAADGKTISATDTTYTAGTNVQINNNVISATDTTYTAGTGIDITNGVISSDITPGSTVIITPSLATGTKVADYSIDGTTGSLYAPNGGGSTVSVTQKTSTGTNIADITVDGVTTQLYAPNGGSGTSAIADLSDVSLTSLTDGDILKYDSTNQEWVNATESGGDITDLDFADMTNSQVQDMMDNLNAGTSDSGTFTTGSQQYEKVEINCGFRPKYVKVILPFSRSDTVAIYDSSISTTTSTWYIPQESRTYTLTLGEAQGETGISDITDTGFKFRCNAGNTRNVSCTFTSNGGDSYIATVDFTKLTQTQINDLKTILGIS